MFFGFVFIVALSASSALFDRGGLVLFCRQLMCGTALSFALLFSTSFFVSELRLQLHLVLCPLM